MKNAKIIINKIDFKLICISIFFFPFLLRNVIVGKNLGWFNIIGVIGLFLMFQRQINKSKNEKLSVFNVNKKNMVFIIYIITMILFVTISLLTNFMSFNVVLKYIVTLFLPISLLFSCLTKSEFESNFKFFVKTLNICCIIIFICGFIDIFNNYSIGTFFATYYDVESLIFTSNNDTRMVSYMGHPLFSAQLFIMCFCMNYLNNKYVKKDEKVLRNIITIIVCFGGIVLAGSKTAIVLFLVLFLLFYTNIKKTKYLIFGIIAFYICYQIGFLDSLFQRFLRGIELGDITTGRNTTLKYLINSNVLKFNFFTGHNVEYTESMTVALEYPILRWSYKFGILFTIVLAIFIFIIPIFKITKYKRADILIAAIAIIVDVNTYSGLCNVSDNMMIYMIVIWLLILLGIYQLKSEKGDAA